METLQKEDIEMADKHMIKYLSSLVIKEMKIKRKWDTSTYALECFKWKRLAIPKYWWWYGRSSTFIHCCSQYKMRHRLWKVVCQLFKNLNIDLSYDPAILVIGFYPREMKAYKHMKT